MYDYNLAPKALEEQSAAFKRILLLEGRALFFQSLGC